MRINKIEAGYLESTKLCGGTNNDAYWIVVTSYHTKKVLSRYGPFEFQELAKNYAKEHHIEITNLIYAV